MYCCCYKKITGNWECECSWDGWISAYDYPPERKNREVPLQKPLKSGKYLVRYQTSSADRYECEDVYHLVPIKTEKGGDGKIYPIHWENEEYEEYEEDCGKGFFHSPYAWKEII